MDKCQAKVLHLPHYGITTKNPPVSNNNYSAFTSKKAIARSSSLDPERAQLFPVKSDKSHFNTEP